jgi:hypothetical protein
VSDNDNQLVDFPGHGRFWFLLDDAGDGPLAPVEHCDENGDVTADHMFSDSYAHVSASGVIKRYHKIIGHRDDLRVVARETL